MASTDSTQTRSTGIGGVAAAGGTTNINARPRSNLFGALLGFLRPPKMDPFIESGRMGTGVWGGFVENIEKDRRLYGQNRWKTASDLVANVSIVAAGLRFFNNLAAAPSWAVKPAEDRGKGEPPSDQAKKLAEFAQDILDDWNTSWSRVVRRSAMFKFHGFGIHEWVAKRRMDGHIGIADVEQRPQHTIERWELADDGTIIGMWQRWPQNGELLFLPRQKVVYLVDDMLTDSPEGMGFFRHMVDPGERLRRYLKMEGLGYERDLRGLPVGRAPLNEMRQAVKNGQMTAEEMTQALRGLEQFLQMQVKEEDSSLLLDSATYRSVSGDGFTITQVWKWAIDLLTTGGASTAFGDINHAIDRLNHDMARIMGVESLLIGGNERGSGSKALSEDKSRNLYLTVGGCVKDISEAYHRDMLGACWKLNGLPDELMPSFHTEDVAFKDVESVAKALSDMALAGAVLQPDDPAINDVRDLLGISKQPDQLPAQASLALPRTPGQPGGPPGAPGAPGAPPAPRPPPEDRIDSNPTHPREPGPSPMPPGSPQGTATREGAPREGPAGRRNRTQSSVIKED